MISGEDFTIHDTVSYENTTPVAERIPRMRKVRVWLAYLIDVCIDVKQ